MKQLSYAAALVAVFVAALVVMVRIGGRSPIIWIDTFNDENEVQRCLEQNSCTLAGVTTSIPGLVAAVSWLELRAGLAWLGVGLDGAHLAVQVLTALGAVLLFHLATRLGGELTGVAAVWLYLADINAMLRASALHNSSVLLALGVVLLLACTVVVERPGLWSVGLAALVGAVLANVHLACVLSGISVTWVALLAPRHRWRLALLAAVVFGGATFALAPPTWQHNVVSLLTHPSGHPNLPGEPLYDPLLFVALFATAAWLASLPLRDPAWARYRQRAQGALAVFVPVVVAVLVAPRVGLNPEPKYLLHAKAACALAAALPIALIVGAALRAVSRHLLAAAEALLPVALAVWVLVSDAHLGVRSAADERMPTVDDLAAVARLLHDQHGWDAARVLSGLKSPYGITAQIGLRQALATLPPPSAEAAAAVDAVLLTVPARDLPRPLPAGWQVVRRAPAATTVLITTPPAIDWSRFEVCARADDAPSEHCAPSGWRAEAGGRILVPEMPPPGQGWRGTIRIQAPLRSGADGAMLFMPHLFEICGGRIASASGAGLRVAGDGRSAVLASPDSAAAGTIALSWQVGAPECALGAYDAVVPFVVAGSPTALRPLESMLRRWEASQ